MERWITDWQAEIVFRIRPDQLHRLRTEGKIEGCYREIPVAYHGSPIYVFHEERLREAFETMLEKTNG